MWNVHHANNSIPHVSHRELQSDRSDEIEQASKSASEQLPKPTSETTSAECTRVCGIEGRESGQDQSLIIPVWVSAMSDKRSWDTLEKTLFDTLGICSISLYLALILWYFWPSNSMWGRCCDLCSRRNLSIDIFGGEGGRKYAQDARKPNFIAKCLNTFVAHCNSANPENKQLTYARIDCQSNATFVT